MKTLFTILAFALVFGALAQEVNTTIIEEQKPECILWPLEVKPIPVVFNVDEYFRRQLWLSKDQHMNIWVNPEARFHLDKDPSFSQILTTGSVYTFEHIRYTVR